LNAVDGVEAELGGDEAQDDIGHGILSLISVRTQNAAVLVFEVTDE
jgi:hypothetical protein